MARFGLTLTAMILGLVPGVARAGWSEPVEATWFAPVPCSVACPDTGLTDDLVDTDSCDREPIAPPGSWDDVRFVAPPLTTGSWLVIQATIRPSIDYDLFLCRVLHAGTPDERWEPVAAGGWWWWCESWTPVEPPLPIGCEDTFNASIDPGATLVLRAYNWSDGPFVHGSYRFGEF